MSLRWLTSLAVVATVFVGVTPTPAAAYMCDLTTVNSVCGPSSGSPDTMTLGPGSGTTPALFGTYNGPGWDAPGNALFDQGAIFAQINIQPTGTGFIDSFLRIQNSPTEQGYNTNARNYNNGGNYNPGAGKTQFDEKSDPNFTRSIRVNDVPIVKIGGVNYREFFLDINENAADPGRLISLDQLEIFLAGSGTLDNYQKGNAQGIGSTLNGANSKLIYTLDTGFSPSTPDNPFQDNWIKLDYLTSSGGSGKGDMVFYLPDSLFANSGFGANPYVYLYSQFGCGGDNINCPTANKFTTDDISQAGFEEWWVRSPLGQQTPGGFTTVPEPTGLLLLGTGLVFAAKRLRKPRMKLAKKAD